MKNGLQWAGFCLTTPSRKELAEFTLHIRQYSISDRWETHHCETFHNYDAHTE